MHWMTLVTNFSLEEYEDYVLLGYRNSAEAVIKGLASDLRKVYTVDANGKFIDDIDMMDNVTNLKKRRFCIYIQRIGEYPGLTNRLNTVEILRGLMMSSGTTSVRR